MNYKNPIISGFYPDPSICRVGDDFYMANSSFEYFPAIPIHHSNDLVHWDLIGYVFDEKNPIQLKTGHPNALGTYAPTIRYHNGIFYLVCTNVAIGDVDDGNFFVWSKDPRNGWSKPIWVDCLGIDPSLYFEGDSVYYVGSDSDIYLCKIDITTGAILEKRQSIWTGSGGNNPEGPHLYKYHDWYYLLIAEGGTELGHMVTVARSRLITGPYESCPRNPILTNRGTNLPIKAVGHADLVEDQNGNWWAVCLGIRPISYPFRHNLGRETFLIPMTWDNDGWPRFGDGHLYESIETPFLPLSPKPILDFILKPYRFLDDFNDQKPLNLHWNFIYRPLQDRWKLSDNQLQLIGNECGLSDSKPLAWVGIRQMHHECVIETKLTFKRAKDLEEAGMTLYLNNRHHYEIALSRIDGQNVVIVRRQIGSLWKIEAIQSYLLDSVRLKLEISKEECRLYYHNQERYRLLGIGEMAYLTTEVGGVFTGNFIALYATGNGEENKFSANFEAFSYQEIL